MTPTSPSCRSVILIDDLALGFVQRLGTYRASPRNTGVAPSGNIFSNGGSGTFASMKCIAMPRLMSALVF